MAAQHPNLIDGIVAAHLAARERVIEAMLQFWISELEPVVVYDVTGSVVGLAAADHIRLGERPFIAVSAAWAMARA